MGRFIDYFVVKVGDLVTYINDDSIGRVTVVDYDLGAAFVEFIDGEYLVPLAFLRPLV